MSFRTQKYENNTNLSRYIWDLKNKGISYNIDWSILSYANTYNTINKTCNLCLLEKVYILRHDGAQLINKRNELMNRCRHRDKFLLNKDRFE